MLNRLALEILSLYLRRTPWKKGRWRLIRLAIPWSREVLGDGKLRIIRTRYNFQIRVEMGDWLGRHIFITGEYEPATANLIAELLQPGDTMIDVGANIGFFTLLAARYVGPSGKIIAFEPLPSARHELEKNIIINNIFNVIVREEAVCDQSGGEITFYEGPSDHRGISSCRPIKKCSITHKVTSECLDKIVPTDQRVDLIKIDVEGAECQAVDGMIQLLWRNRPDVIVEVTDHYLQELGHSAEALCERLRALGYRMYAIDYNGLVPVVNDLSGFPSQFNALFTMRTHLPARLRVKDSWSRRPAR